MKAVVYKEPFRVAVEKVADPKIEHPNDVIVKITSTAICGSDLHLYEVLGPFMDAGDIIGHERFLEAYLNTPLDVCEERDPKGLYRRARKGEITSFTGVSPDAPYEPPAAPDIMLDTTTADAEQCARILLAAVLN